MMKKCYYCGRPVRAKEHKDVLTKLDSLDLATSEKVIDMLSLTHCRPEKYEKDDSGRVVVCGECVAIALKGA
jgi:hypothetical protein